MGAQRVGEEKDEQTAKRKRDDKTTVSQNAELSQRPRTV